MIRYKLYNSFQEKGATVIDFNDPKFSMRRHTKLAVVRGIFDVPKHPGRSFVVILTVAVGVALAIGIIAVANGVNDQVKNLLHVIPVHLSFIRVYNTLDETRDALTYLTYIFCGFFVVIVTWVSMEKRRYYISVTRMRGEPITILCMEFLTESMLLCILGGLFGIVLGYGLCQYIPYAFPHLPIHFKWMDVIRVYPEVSGFSFIIASLITFIFAVIPNITRER